MFEWGLLIFISVYFIFKCFFPREEEIKIVEKISSTIDYICAKDTDNR